MTPLFIIYLQLYENKAPWICWLQPWVQGEIRKVSDSNGQFQLRSRTSNAVHYQFCTTFHKLRRERDLHTHTLSGDSLARSSNTIMGSLHWNWKRVSDSDGWTLLTPQRFKLCSIDHSDNPPQIEICGWSWTCTNMWLSPPLLSRQDLYCLGESIHLEIEKDMAFLFRKVMSLEYDMDSDDYSLWLVTSSGSFVDSTFLVPPVGALLSHHLLLYRTSIFRHSGLPSSLGFSATPTGEKCQQRDIVKWSGRPVLPGYLRFPKPACRSCYTTPRCKL